MTTRCWCGEVAYRAELCQKHYENKYRTDGRGGFVYAISCDATDPISVKIGYSISPDYRCIDLQAGSPVDLKLLGKIAGNLKLERKIHAELSEYRVRQEWFRYEGLAKVIVDFIVDDDYESLVDLIPGFRNISDFERKLNQTVVFLP